MIYSLVFGSVRFRFGLKLRLVLVFVGFFLSHVALISEMKMKFQKIWFFGGTDAQFGTDIAGGARVRAQLVDHVGDIGIDDDCCASGTGQLGVG